MSDTHGTEQRQATSPAIQAHFFFQILYSCEQSQHGDWNTRDDTTHLVDDLVLIAGRVVVVVDRDGFGGRHDGQRSAIGAH